MAPRARVCRCDAHNDGLVCGVLYSSRARLVEFASLVPRLLCGSSYSRVEGHSFRCQCVGSLARACTARSHLDYVVWMMTPRLFRRCDTKSSNQSMQPTAGPCTVSLFDD
jgi:hypothetical protein